MRDKQGDGLEVLCEVLKSGMGNGNSILHQAKR